MKNIHILPTPQPSRLWKNNLLQGILILNEDALLFNTAQNIYITNDEKIKDGEYGLSRLGEIIKFNSGYDYRYYAKIILTTDQDLINDGVQAIDNEFLEWFVKNPSCEEVKTNYIQEPCLNCEWNYDSCPNAKECLKGKYKIIIPKEEPKPIHEQIIEHCGGEEKFMEICGLKPKQETLEERKWLSIFKEYTKDGESNLFMFFNWLEINYNPPTKK
jgi:hypothetical protein